ncbi:glucosamine-6-phosphate deaminase [Saccharospirillum sp. MSK14-1]|uniref:glucosamine-6-phosphate deaminase n=1 Tax=Saccharospirillum sp. MSK14-1 TaxID=1897632 RepID=UPI000D395D4A|nr:glucosamine-6-phosphate deaminase [Saccharospirillum sp. MSK14-1]PTY38046.1 glucosamine-6-phosphate deaminase [Saccharospirillum sp. MSK14-1]
MQIVILDTPEAVANYGADQFVARLQKKPQAVLGLATGSTPIALYRELIRRYQAGDVSFAQARSFNLDEYLGLDGDHPQSYRHFMNAELFSQIDIDLAHTQVPDGAADDPLAACEAYETAIKNAGLIDLQLLGIGRNGHIGFNEPSSSLASRTRVKTLTPDTVEANKRFFKPDEFQPNLAITMGIGTIMEARHILLLATGESKAEAIREAVEGPVAARCPASILQMHPRATLVLDRAAARGLKDVDFYEYIERENQRLLGG